MKKILAIAILPLLILSLSGLTSCKNRSAKQEQKKIELEQLEEIKESIKENVYPIPNSADVISMLSDYGVGYLTDISNPPENVRKYFVSSKQALNLGAFGADLSYATLYNQQQLIINYMEAIRNLANELKIPMIFDEAMYERIKANAENKDSLVSILTNAFNDTYAELSENDQQALGLLVVGGAWVEGMHLATHVSGAAYNIEAVSKVLLKQKDSFDKYIEITGTHMDDPALSEFVKMLDPIKQVYAGITTSLTQKNIDDITRAIDGIRKQVVQ